MRRCVPLMCLLLVIALLSFPSTKVKSATLSATLIEVPRIHVEPLYYDGGTLCEEYSKWNDVWSCPTDQITNECSLQSTELVYSEVYCY